VVANAPLDSSRRWRDETARFYFDISIVSFTINIYQNSVYSDGRLYDTRKGCGVFLFGAFEPNAFPEAFSH
jgi:hypothetical protein